MRATLLLAGLLASALAALSALLAPVTVLPLGIARPRWALMLFGVTFVTLAWRAVVAPSAAGGYWALLVVLLTALAWRAAAEEARSR